MSARPPFLRPRWKTWTPVGLALLCFAASAVLVLGKARRGYRLVGVDREEAWRVVVAMDADPAGGDLVVRCMRPEPATARQRVLSLEYLDDGMARAEEGHYTVWRKPPFTGRARPLMKFRVRTEAKAYDLPAVLEWEDLPRGGLEAYLKTEELTQADHPDIRAQAELLRSASDDAIGFVQALFRYVKDEVRYRRAPGPADALSALRLGEAACDGKNRLFVALARSQGIPARLAKGLILKQGARKAETHAWSELFLDQRWVPFCPVAGYFAAIPAEYLEYPKADERMFRHSRGARFDYEFRIGRGVQTVEEALKADLDNPGHPLAAWGSLGTAGYSLDLLTVILTVPVGVTVVAFARNVVGLVPFGTFLPALIAVSFRDTGLGWGLALFTAILAAGVLANELLRPLHLLHFPRLAVMVVVVVGCVIGLSLLALRFENMRAARVGMFPLAIVTLTIERFSIARERDGAGPALLRLAASLLVASACYAVMMNFRLRSAVLVFPELLLACAGANLLLGTFTGLRWSEYLRFRLLGSSK